MRVAILHAGEETDYLFGLVRGLATVEGLAIDVIDSNRSLGLFDGFPSVTHYPLRGGQTPSDPLHRKIAGILRYYLRLVHYAATSKAEVFHLQWDNSILIFDRTILVSFYKLLGKKIIRTVHNVDPDARDGRPSRIRSWSLRRLYRGVDRIIVHTDLMQKELVDRFAVPDWRVRVIPHGINDRVPVRGLSRDAARDKLGIARDKKVLLFFGYIDRYKGLDLLVDAAAGLMEEDRNITLVIAGAVKRRDDYMPSIERTFGSLGLSGRVVRHLRFIPANEIERYFAAADCLVLPYRSIFQSGVIFLAYRFGLPIVATDVGSFRADIREGKDGFIAEANTSEGLARAIRKFFASPLYDDATAQRRRIREDAERRYAWRAIAQSTADIYRDVLTESGSGRR
jgi:D-inositol-3-phosphate glycosyltransferase